MRSTSRRSRTAPARNQAESLTAATVLRVAQAAAAVRLAQARLRHRRQGQPRAVAGRPSAADLVERARTPVVGCHRLAVISLKGGVGKTTTTAALGAMFANLRGDRVIAVDANPDRGTLIERVPRESGATVRHLLEHRDRVTATPTSARSPRSRRPGSRCSPPTPTPARRPRLSEQDYRDTVDTLERFYNLILTDCGTGLLHDAMRGVLGLANSLVVVSSASLDGARSASATLDWLEAHGLRATSPRTLSSSSRRCARAAASST